MRKITFITIALITLCYGFLKAQTEQGKVLVGVSSALGPMNSGAGLMSLGATTVKMKTDAEGFIEPEANKRTNINVSPKVGIFVFDDLLLGLDMSYSRATETDGDTKDKYSRRIMSTGPFIRYYAPIAKVKPFIDFGTSFGTIKERIDYTKDYQFDDKELKSSIMSIGGGLGVAVLVGKRVTFDLLGGYNSSILKIKEDNEYNTRTVVGTIGLKIGVSVLLGAM